MGNRRIVVANQKGGVGKTTTVINIAAALAQGGMRTLVVDLDPQGHSTVGMLDHPVEATMIDVFGLGGRPKPLSDVIVASAIEGIDIAPASKSMYRLEGALSESRGEHMVVREGLRSVEDRYDVVVIDTPPNLGILLTCGLVAGTDVLVPIKAGFADAEGMTELLGTIRRIVAYLNPDLKVLGAFLTMTDLRRIADQRVLELVRTSFGEVCMESTIRASVKLIEQWVFKKSIFSYAPTSNAASDYRALAREVMARVGQ